MFNKDLRKLNNENFGFGLYDDKKQSYIFFFLMSDFICYLSLQVLGMFNGKKDYRLVSEKLMKVGYCN